MRKKIFAAILIIAIILIGAGITLFWKAADIVAAYKPEIQAKLSQAIGSDVSIGEISLSILPRTSISISRVTAKDRGGEQVGISVAALKANAELLPILSKQIKISSIAIEAPKVTLRKDATGISISGIKKRDDAPTHPTPERSTTEGAKGSSGGIVISIDSISVRRGEIRMEEATTGNYYEIREIDLDAAVRFEENGLRISGAGASLVAPGSHTIRALVESLSLSRDNTGLTVRGASIETPGGSVSVSGAVSTTTAPGSLQIASNGLDLTALSKIAAPFVPQLAAYKPIGSVGMNIDVKLVGLAVQSVNGPVSLKEISALLPNSMNLSNLSGAIVIEGSPANLGVMTDALHLKLQDAPMSIAATARITPQDVAINTLTLRGFGGEVQAPSRLSIDVPVTLSTQTSIRSLSLAALLQVIKPELSKVVSGTVVGFDASLQNIVLTNPAASTRGPGNFAFKDGVIKGFNLPHQVLSNIEGLPFVSGSLRKRVPPEFEAFVSKPDTAIKDLRSRFSIENGRVTLAEFSLISDIFTLYSSGAVSVDGELDLDSAILFSPEFSIALTSKVKELKPLLDGEQRLIVPLVVRGKAPSIVVVPNVAKLVQKATMGTVRETLSGAVRGGSGVTKSLGKILGF